MGQATAAVFSVINRYRLLFKLLNHFRPSLTKMTFLILICIVMKLYEPYDGQKQSEELCLGNLIGPLNFIIS